MSASFPTRHASVDAGVDANTTRRPWADPRRYPHAVVAAVVETIQRRWCESLGVSAAPRPRVAIILGTGLGGVADVIDVDAEIPYGEIPPFVSPTAVGHQGRLLLGRLGSVAETRVPETRDPETGDPETRVPETGDPETGVPVVAFAGRVHVYEGHGLRQVVLPVEVAAALGAEVLVVSSASGGLNPTFRAGDVVVVDDHIDFTFAAPLSPRDHTRRHNLGDVYDRELVEVAHRAARRHGPAAYRGVYAAVPGPNYETRAEIRMLRAFGADIVGMSTVPEVVAARQLGLRAVVLSVVTNQCNPDRVVHVTGNEVAESAARAEQHVGHIVRDLVAHIGAAPVSP